MPQTVTVDAFSFDELSDEAKERARNWYREARYGDSSDFDSVIEDFVQIAEIIGISFDTHEVPLMSGKTRSEPNIWWSGFCCQGDGACFEGTYEPKPDSCAKIRAYCSDETLIGFADDLARLQAANVMLHGTTFAAAIRKHDNHYCHEHTVSIDLIDIDSDDDRDMAPLEDEVASIMRGLMRWLYKQLEAEDDYLNSNEYIDETIAANDYMFDEEGDRHAYA